MGDVLGLSGLLLVAYAMGVLTGRLSTSRARLRAWTEAYNDGVRDGRELSRVVRMRRAAP
jgi:hypothetical protein